MTKQFVCIFVGDDKMMATALVRKSKGPTPDKDDGQKGHLNGWGGKVEKEDATLLHACQREFKEEAGMELPLTSFIHFVTEVYQQRRENIMVHFYYVNSTELMSYFGGMFQSLDGDPVVIKSVPDIDPNEKWVWNTQYLLLMAQTMSKTPKRYWPMREEVGDVAEWFTRQEDGALFKKVRAPWDNAGT